MDVLAEIIVELCFYGMGMFITYIVFWNIFGAYRVCFKNKKFPTIHVFTKYLFTKVFKNETTLKD